MAGNTSNRPLAAIYAQALYEAAGQSKVVEQVGLEIDAVLDILEKNPRVATFLDVPTISFKDKRTVIEQSFRDCAQITRNFLLVLVERSRTHLLSQIVQEYQKVVDVKNGVARVNVASARALEPLEQARLKQVLGDKLKLTIELKERVDPALLGGVIVTHKDTRWDGSVRAKLHEIVSLMEEGRAVAGK